MPLSRPHLEEGLAALRAVFGDRFSTEAADRAEHGRDHSWHAPRPPDAVCWPISTEEVAEAVRLCARYDLPVIPFGSGTSLEGHVLAVQGGVSLDLRRMNQIRAVNEADFDCIVEAGLTRKELDRRLAETPLFFPVGPGVDATLGGMASTRASGTNAVRYGTMRDNVIALTVVLPDGRIIHTGSRARKSAAGYDLTRLFIGAEGTLGVITELTLRLYSRPPVIAAAVVSFPDIDAAARAVIGTIQAGIPVARIELLDEVMIGAVNRYAGLDYPVAPTLFIEFHGTQAGVREQAERMAAVVAAFGGGDYRWATDEAERARLWQARHDAYFAALALRPGARSWGTDVCVPLSRLAECIGAARADLAASRLIAPLVSHAGDGNFHLMYLIDPDDPGEVAEAERLNARMVRNAQALGGTCTGEHGVGMGKTRFLGDELGDAVDVLRALKDALDPRGIMNPGKVVPPAPAPAS